MIDSLRQVYNDIGKNHAHSRPLWPEMKRWVAGFKAGDKVLDVGCGEGRLLQGLKLKLDYTGVDFSDELIRVARKRHGGKQRRFIVGEISEDDVWKGLGKFDHILAVAVVHHLPTKKEQLFVLRKMKAHLKPGGKMYVSGWNLWQAKYLGEHLKNLVLKLSQLPESFNWVKIPFRKTKLTRFYFAGSMRYWEKLLQEAGWKNVKMAYGKGKNNMWVVLEL